MKRLMFYSKRKLPSITGGTDFFRKNSIIIFLTLMFVCGMIIGISIYFGADKEKNLIELFIRKYLFQQTFSYFLNNLLLTALFYISALLGGLNAAGIPFIAAVPVCRGILNGLLSAYLINTYSATGYGYYALITVPGACLNVCVLLYLCNMCCSLSGKVFKSSFLEEKERINSAKMLIIFGICCLLGLASCGIDLLMKLIFHNVFNLQ